VATWVAGVRLEEPGPDDGLNAVAQVEPREDGALADVELAGDAAQLQRYAEASERWLRALLSSTPWGTQEARPRPASGVSGVGVGLRVRPATRTWLQSAVASARSACSPLTPTATVQRLLPEVDRLRSAVGEQTAEQATPVGGVAA
jgi:hypothetical protein